MRRAEAVILATGRSDQEATGLLRGLRIGSTEAWARLYDDFAPGIRQFAATRLLGDLETADDVVGETLAAAARDIRRFDSQRSSLSAWLYGIARRRVHDEARRRRRRKSVPTWAQVPMDALAEAGDGEDLASSASARLDAERRITELESVLSDVEMELVTLSYAHDLSVKEIAQVATRSEQAVHSILHRAKRKARGSVVEGTLLSVDIDVSGAHIRPSSHWFSGIDDWRTGTEFGMDHDLSPMSDQVVYAIPRPGDTWYPRRSREIWRSKRDGSGAANLSEEAGLKGINWSPGWSPDGTMIAFMHADLPEKGHLADHELWGQLWVMKADGSEVHSVTPEGSPPIWGYPVWAPDGSRIVYCATNDLLAPPIMSTDIWGREIRVLPWAKDIPAWSPDGSMIAMVSHHEGQVDGERGQWNRLILMKKDCSEPKVLMEQFIADADVAAHRPMEFLREFNPAIDWERDLKHWAGPIGLTWSPRGDKIAFLGMLPFDPDGPRYQRQVEAWIYDLATGQLTRITHDDLYQHGLIWR